MKSSDVILGRRLSLLVVVGGAALALLVQGCQATAAAAPEAVAMTSEELRTTCADGPVTRGIDVSKWQGTINWDQVAGSGVRFAFIRVSDGARVRDMMFSRCLLYTSPSPRDS